MQNEIDKAQDIIPIRTSDIVIHSEKNAKKSTVNYLEIGNRIKTERDNFHMTREKLSELLDISTNFLGQIERGERKMSINTMINISECLHTPIDYLIFGEAYTDTNDILYDLLSKCSEKESAVFQSIIMLLLPHLAR